MKRRSITAYWLGRIAYERAHVLQQALVDARIRTPERFGDVILLLEHDPVVTLGRGAKEENILAGDEDLRARGVTVSETGRGGDVTFHGPGQLVAYPIIDLKPERCDVRKYVRDLAEVMIRIARDHGVAAGVLPGDPKYVGVWVDESSPKTWDEARSLAASRGDVGAPSASTSPRLAKIGAIGVRLSRWITMHGFALNVATDLSGFRLIVPCGIQALGVASLTTLGAEPPSVEEVARRSLPHFAGVFDADVVLADATLVGALAALADDAAAAASAAASHPAVG
ncbi:MAG: lipoyl(octanoyl) transferase [Myxococcales bacterium]|nr:lipoyl(octanoyl) transferase [Myxococcales bacterium]